MPCIQQRIGKTRGTGGREYNNYHMVSERCDELGSGPTGRSTETREIALNKKTPERVPAPIPENPVRRTQPPETTTMRFPIRDKSFRAILPDREIFRECDYRIVPSGSVDKEDRGGNIPSWSQPDLSVVCLEGSSGTRRKSNRVYGEIRRLLYFLSFRRCIVFQSERQR